MILDIFIIGMYVLFSVLMIVSTWVVFTNPIAEYKSGTVLLYIGATGFMLWRYNL